MIDWLVTRCFSKYRCRWRVCSVLGTAYTLTGTPRVHVHASRDMRQLPCTRSDCRVGRDEQVICPANSSVFSTASRHAQRAGARLTRTRSGSGVAVVVHVARYGILLISPRQNCTALTDMTVVRVRASNPLRLSVPCRCSMDSRRLIAEYARPEAPISRFLRNATMPAR